MAAYTVDIHGYGNQDFWDAGKNQYRDAKGGTWEQHSMSLIFTAEVTDDTTIWARIHHDPDSEAIVDWLYVDKKIGQNIDVRVGSQKYPLGIYNLFAENKFLEVSELEPQMYNEDVDHLIFDIFNGVDVEYNGGPVGIEVFGGGHEEGTGEAKNMRGIRIPYRTPVDGLTIIGSAASFREETTTGPTMTSEQQTVLVGSIDYVNHSLDLKAEFAEKKMKNMDVTVRSYYLQAGYTFFDRLTPYARYDILYSDTHQTSDPSLYQKDTTAGLGYKINDHLKVKAEGHFINGYNVPVQSGDVAAGTGQKNWTLFVSGVNFIF